MSPLPRKFSGAPVLRYLWEKIENNDDGEIFSGTILMTNLIKILPLIRELLRKQKQIKDNESACFRMTEEGGMKRDLGK
jgi:hypothetical protein